MLDSETVLKIQLQTKRFNVLNSYIPKLRISYIASCKKEPGITQNRDAVAVYRKTKQNIEILSAGNENNLLHNNRNHLIVREKIQDRKYNKTNFIKNLWLVLDKSTWNLKWTRDTCVNTFTNSELYFIEYLFPTRKMRSREWNEISKIRFLKFSTFISWNENRGTSLLLWNGTTCFHMEPCNMNRKKFCFKAYSKQLGCTRGKQSKCFTL